MRFVGYTPIYSSAVAALVSVPTNESKTGEGLVKMRSLWGENTDDSETGSGLNSFEKETSFDWSYCTDKQCMLNCICKRWVRPDRTKFVSCRLWQVFILIAANLRMCYFMSPTFSIKLSITWLSWNVCAHENMRTAWGGCVRLTKQYIWTKGYVPR